MFGNHRNNNVKNSVVRSDGTYYTPVDGHVTGEDGVPVLPVLPADLTAVPGLVKTLIFWGGTATRIIGAPPLQHLSVAQGGSSQGSTDFDAPGWYPMNQVILNTLETADGVEQGSVMIAGQAHPGHNLQRIFTEMQVVAVIPVTEATDTTPPQIGCLESQRQGQTLAVTVDVTDPSGLEIVLLTYTADGNLWQSLPLTDDGSGRWTGSFTTDTKTEYLIQALDQVGNLVIDDNDGTYFKKRSTRSCSGQRTHFQVKKTGSGSGTILVGDQVCDETCQSLTLTVPTNTRVDLRAYPAEGSVFVRWEWADGTPLLSPVTAKPGQPIYAVFEQQ